MIVQAGGLEEVNCSEDETAEGRRTEFYASRHLRRPCINLTTLGPDINANPSRINKMVTPFRTAFRSLTL